MSFQLILPSFNGIMLNVVLPTMNPIKMTTLLEQFVSEQMIVGGSCDTSEVFEKFCQWKQGKVYQGNEYSALASFTQYCWNKSNLIKADKGKVPYSMKLAENNMSQVIVPNIDMQIAQRLEREDTIASFIGQCTIQKVDSKVRTYNLYARWCIWLTERSKINPYNSSKAFITEFNRNYSLTYRNVAGHIYNIILREPGTHDYKARFDNYELEYEFTDKIRHLFGLTAEETTIFFNQYNMTKEEFEQYRDSSQLSNVKNMVISYDEKGNPYRDKNGDIVKKWDGNINNVIGNTYQINNSKPIWNAVAKWYNLLYHNNKDALDKFSHKLEVIDKNNIQLDLNTSIIKLDIPHAKTMIVKPTIALDISAANDIKSPSINLVIAETQRITGNKHEMYDTFLQELVDLTGLSLLKIDNFITIRRNKYLNLDTGNLLKVNSATKKLRYNTKELICSDMSDLKIFNNVVDKFTQLISYHSITDTRTILEKEIDNIFNNDQNDIKRQAITAELRQKLFIQSDAKCYCCESKIAISFFELGHIIPHKFGGSTKEDNLLAICEECNDSMGTANLFEFMIVRKQNILNIKILSKEHSDQIKYIKSINQQSAMLLKLLHTMKLGEIYKDKVKYIFTKYRKFYIDDRNKLNLLLNTLI